MSKCINCKMAMQDTKRRFFGVIKSGADESTFIYGCEICFPNAMELINYVRNNKEI